MDTQKPPHGEARRLEILDAIKIDGDDVEDHYLEVKSTIDLSKPVGKATVAKFILGAANRPVELAERNFGGYALMVLGAQKGESVGVEAGIEVLTLKQKVEKYVGQDGPEFILEKIKLDSGKEVLFIIVDPPKRGQPAFICRGDYQAADPSEKKYALVDGGIYIRPTGNTRPAKSAEIFNLRRRGQANPQLALDVHVEGKSHWASGSDELLEEFVQIRSEMEREVADERSGFDASSPLSRAMRSVSIPGIENSQQMEARISKWERKVRGQWREKTDILVGLLYPGISFSVFNNENAFLEDFRIVLSFPGVRGVPKMPRDTDLDDIFTPIPPPEISPASLLSQIQPYTPGALFNPSYPVNWKNKTGSVEVTIDLPNLRPQENWVSDDDDLVLVGNEGQVGTIRGTWIATAKGYGRPLTGEVEVEVREERPLVGLYRHITSPNDEG